MSQIQPYSLEEKQLMFHIARESILSRLEQKEFHYPSVTDNLKAERGVFTTLKIEGNLRGCIGYTDALFPLYEGIHRTALAAAFEDPRFPPLHRSEYEVIDLELSVLTPMEKCDNPDDVEVGVHGLMIRKGYHSGLLLPQVPLEYGWNRREFWEHTCMKAGLPTDAWTDKNAELYRFTAIVLEESELNE